MKEKYIQIKEGKRIWEIPLKVIADNRAQYYSDKEEVEEGRNAVYNEEYEHAMTDDYDGIDWFKNNMEWEQVSMWAKLVGAPPPSDNPDDWRNAEMEIINKTNNK